MFKPLEKMWERVENERADSDTAFFFGLLNLGEMITKWVVSAMVAAIPEEKNRLRYQKVYDLVRADGVGEWANTLDDILTGPAAQIITSEVRQEQRELTERLGPASWQYEAIYKLQTCLMQLDAKSPELPARVDGRRWFHLFAHLRNKTRGHGAQGGGVLGRLCLPIEESLLIVSKNLSIFNREWAFLHRNLSGKYRVSPMSAAAPRFDSLKKSTTETLADGVYVYYGTFARVELAESNPDLTDYFLANGHFNDSTFEMLSYITGDRLDRPSDEYLVPPNLPRSETEGLGELEVRGNCFTNLPLPRGDYVPRHELETEVLSLVLDENHPIVTLGGAGGIGKTSLALAVLDHPLVQERFSSVIWFSARDIDLLGESAKPVKAHIMNEEDAAQEFSRLIQAGKLDRRARLDLLARSLNTPKFPLDLVKNADCKPHGETWKTLFVFDNFETVIRPAEFFKWLDTNIRSPNKILITTRVRSFRGDYPVDVAGMNEDECKELVDRTANTLRIGRLITDEYNRELFRESQGHPYVIKILLGEAAKDGRRKKIEHIVADRNDILQALFERTYANLSPGARRVFLTLCNWRSTVPQIALEAVMLRPQNEDTMDVLAAVEELHRSSLIEITESEADGELFLSVPLVATLFGKRKIEASPLNAIVKADTELLQYFGAGQRTDVRHGVGPRIARLIRSIARDPTTIKQYQAVLEFIARKHPPTWKDLAKLYEEAGDLERAKEAYRQLLEHLPKEEWLEALDALAQLCQGSGDLSGEIDALVKKAELEDVDYRTVSNAANRFNAVMRASHGIFESEEKRVLARQLRFVMEDGIAQASANDLSRLAWLCLHLGDEAAARKYALDGIQKEPDNEYCLNLAERSRWI